MSAPSKYTLLYWPTIPGRGEPIRLAFEATGTPYTDVSNTSPDGINAILDLISPTTTHDPAGNPPIFAPPALRVSGTGHGGKDLLLTQTPNILAYLGPHLGLAGPDDGVSKWHIHALALTALDWNNEAHDTHHPIAVSAYYEEQKAEALKKAADFRTNRIPKFLAYFERVLKGNALGAGRFLVGAQLSYADLTLWQVLDGLRFAFPKEIAARAEEFPGVLGGFYEGVKGNERIKAYLESERRLPYSDGIYRHYPELDRQ